MALRFHGNTSVAYPSPVREEVRGNSVDEDEMELQLYLRPAPPSSPRGNSSSSSSLVHLQGPLLAGGGGGGGGSTFQLGMVDGKIQLDLSGGREESAQQLGSTTSSPVVLQSDEWYRVFVSLLGSRTFLTVSNMFVRGSVPEGFGPAGQTASPDSLVTLGGPPPPLAVVSMNRWLHTLTHTLTHSLT